MTATYWRQDPGEMRVRAAKSSAALWIIARAAGVHFDFRDGAYCTFGLTGDARQHDLRRWEADTALSSLCRAVREHERLAADPVCQLLAGYIAIEYVTALWDKKR